MISSAYIRSVVLCATLAFVCSGKLSAQRQTFRQYGSQEGLTNLTVGEVLQDRTGFIWVGTENGLFRYDGNSFRRFDHNDGLLSTEILSLTEAPDGSLWVATTSGVARGSSNGFKLVATGIAESADTVAFDGRGRIYLKYPFGIVRGVPNGAGPYQFHTVVSGTTYGLLVDAEDVWFAKDGDVWRLSENRLERMGSPYGLPADAWRSVVKDARGNLWARSLTRLYCLPRGLTRFVNRSKGIPTGAVQTRLYTDRHGRVYVCEDSGVVVFDGATRIDIDSKHGFPADVVRTILLDREENLWIGTAGGGLVRRLGHGEWLAWRKEDGIAYNTVWAIKHDRAERVWVGTRQGLSLLGSDNHRGRSWTTRDGLAGNGVQAIVEGPSGDLFVTTDPVGISHFSKQGTFLRTYGLHPA